MQIIDPSYIVIDKINGEEILKKIEKCGRVCYLPGTEILTDSGLVIARKDWKWVHYSINKEKVELLNNYLK